MTIRLLFRNRTLSHPLYIRHKVIHKYNYLLDYFDNIKSCTYPSTKNKVTRFFRTVKLLIIKKLLLIEFIEFLDENQLSTYIIHNIKLS